MLSHGNIFLLHHFFLPPRFSSLFLICLLSLLQSIKSFSDVPVVNALCNKHHPMQALADILTIQEVFGREARPVICFMGNE
jgi:hypothetical protein